MSGECSVCLTYLDQEAEVDYEALKDSLAKEVAKMEKLLKSVILKAEELRKEFDQTRSDQEGAARDVSRLASGGTAQEEQKLRLEAARIEGMLEAVSKLVQTDNGEESDLTILDAATDVATEEVKAAAEAVLTRSGELICALVKRLGMSDVEQVVLKRNGNVEVHKGGSVSFFGRLSPGERLRVRIATVVALLQAAQQFGAGRHPGFLIIDSPAKEEMADANVEEMLEALAELSGSVNIQLLVAFRGTDRALKHFPEDHCLLARKGETFW
jgi:DNA repair exonuclease SbcCD ATPase subunit